MESFTRTRLIGGFVSGTLAALSICGIAAARVEATGTFALLGGSPRILSKLWSDRTSARNVTLEVRQFQPSGRPILNYQIDMQRLMHLVVIRDDFATFAHLHPDFDATTGTFRQLFEEEPNHRYYVYADTTPSGVGQQVFRFTLGASGVAESSPAIDTTPVATAAAAPYTVTLSAAKLAARRPQMLTISVLEGGKPAGDLGTYLGAAAHAVLIDTQTLAYVHLHPTVRGAPSMAMASGSGMDMSGAAAAGPLMELSLPALPAAPYKLWLQFRGAGEGIYTAPFTLLVR